MTRVTLEADEALAVGTRDDPLQIRIGDQMAKELALRISTTSKGRNDECSQQC